ncbi:MAG: flippase-like domain-containing protein [Gammaproteobacteria bacterium]|nr:flippase-like domain-containing protein [Gammaproteobacteria bacterium]MBU1653301.1 flippase-like domain-containing protein [Gammaproteobacteria bacterium]MBU1962441.1 flippase-like domain-containing protein [Gammaproteobacteria bacterium]
MSGRLRDWTIGSLILAILIYWVETRIGWGALLAPWRGMSPWQLLYLFALSLFSYLIRGVRIYDYFHARLKGQLLPTIRLSILHNFANNLLPMRAGEAVFPLLMKRYFGQGMTDSALSLLWIRGLDLHLLILIAFGALYLREPGPLWPALAALWIGGLFLVYPLRAPFLRWSGERSGKPAGLLRKVLQSLPGSQAGFFRAYLWTFLTWATKFVAFTLVLLHFLPIPLSQAVMGVMGSELSSVLPLHGVAGSGSYELGMVAVLVPLGLDAKAVLSAAVNLHLFLLGVTLLLGPTALLFPRPKGEGRQVNVS